ncbi:hypothetical protein ILUMI_06594 [Ignelater luminosus]|uniref:Uncharacterized protein n=1 Tax=Ignelater luminosus TaxID=2038154 RepID=A0A8K0D9Y7_IGNLU|nr:hypothetical protein ILUMI_06594 [Ignelater luminosus]
MEDPDCRSIGVSEKVTGENEVSQVEESRKSGALVAEKIDVPGKRVNTNDLEEAWNQRIKVKRLVKEAERAEWEKFDNFLEEDFSENQKLFYKTLKRMSKPKECPIRNIMNKEGKVLKDEEGDMERWRKYFSMSRRTVMMSLILKLGMERTRRPRTDL